MLRFVLTRRDEDHLIRRSQYNNSHHFFLMVTIREMLLFLR